MKLRIFSLVTILAVLLVGIAPGAVFAQAYNVSFTTSITYQNVGNAATNTLQVWFYEDATSTTPIIVDRPSLAAGAGTSLYIGSLSEVADNFQGTAIMQSDQPLLATLVQLPSDPAGQVKNRPLSNGFSSGTEKSLIATVLKNQFNSTTRFSVQNAGGSATNATIKFYDTSANLKHSITENIQPGAGFYVDAGLVTQLGNPFNGSVVIEAPGGEIVSSAMELSTNGPGASAFEGVGAGAKTFYMPSALCEAFGSNTAYAVQNTSLTTQTNVTVTYSNGATQSAPIGPGAKASFIACQANNMTTGFSGAAVVTSTTTDVIAIGKAYGSGLSTAFVGASQGASELALPYVRWASNADWASGKNQRTFITIQNIGSALADKAVKVEYVDKNGVVVGTHELGPMASGAKLNSFASDAGLSVFGIYPDGSFGGGAIITGPSGSQLAVVARVSTQVSFGSFVGEDYNGMPIPSP